MADSRSSLRNLGFAALVLSSGFCGISYEILYARILGDLIGDQFVVNASILLSFLSGIGLGTYFAHRFWAHLWLIEGAIGLYGMLFASCSVLLDRLLYTYLPIVETGLAGALLICIILLLLPAFLIGASLPIFAGYLGRLSPGLVFARAYAFYNLGAAITVLAIEYGLIRLLGIRAATYCIAGVNGLVALLLITFFAGLRAEKPDEKRVGEVRFPPLHLIALAIASVASAVFQLLMIKLAECIFGPFRESFALVLSLILLGIACGSALTRLFRLNIAVVLMANLAGLIWMIGGFGAVAELYATCFGHIADRPFLIGALKLGTLVLVMGLPALSFGATIPALISAQMNTAKESGKLLFISSMANACGFLLMAFYLHPRFDYGILIVIISGIVSAALIFAQLNSIYGIAFAVVAFSLAVFVHQKYWEEDLLYLGYTSFDSAEDLKQERDQFDFPEKFKGHRSIFSITWARGVPHFFINGYISMALNAEFEPLVGAYASVFAPRSDRALVLGLGSGATASITGMLYEHTDAVEINGAVLENLYRMKEYNFDIENNPKVTIIHDDAIHYVKSTRETYSLIINTVTTPLYFSSAKLYTEDFLEMTKRRLSPDGVYVTWIDSRAGENGIDIMLKTLSHSFDHCAIAYIRSSYFLLICSREPIQAHQARIVADHPVAGPFFMDKFGIKPDWLSYGLLSTRAADLVGNRDLPLNTLDYPSLEFEMSRLHGRGYAAFQRRLMNRMDITDVEDALASGTNWNPVYLLAQAEVLLEESRYTRQWRRLVSDQLEDFQAQYDAAKVEYYEAFAAAGNHADRHHKLGFYLMRNGQYGEAIDSFREALVLNPGYNNTYFNIGACYEYKEEYALALENFRAELSVDPGDRDAPFRIGRVLVKMGSFEDGLKALDDAVRIRETADVHFYRGAALEGSGSLDDAVLAYEAALRIDRDHVEAIAAMARLRPDGG